MTSNQPLGPPSLIWQLAGNTTGVSLDIAGPLSARTGDFTGVGRTQLLTWDPLGTGDMWLGTVAPNGSLSWDQVLNTSAISGTEYSVGGFTVGDRTELLFYVGTDINDMTGGDWYVDSVVVNDLVVQSVGTIPELLVTYPTLLWTGDFSGIGRAQLMLYIQDGQNWWLGTVTDNQLWWSLVGNTQTKNGGPDYGVISSNRFWVGDFTGSGRAQIMFLVPGADGNWFLGTVTNNRLGWNLVGNTQGKDGGPNFGDISSNPFWASDFTGSGRAQILFYSYIDQNWWLGTIGAAQMGIVPDVSGFSPLQASNTIVGAGFVYAEIRDEQDGGPKFAPYAEDQNPGPNSEAQLGTVVTVTIAYWVPPPPGPPR